MTQRMHKSVNGHRSATSIDFGITDKFGQVGEFTSKEFMNNEDQLKSVKMNL